MEKFLGVELALHDARVPERVGQAHEPSRTRVVQRAGRQVAKRLKTSVPQLYRLLDPANTRKSMKQLVALLHILNCDVDLVVKKREAA